MRPQVRSEQSAHRLAGTPDGRFIIPALSMVVVILLRTLTWAGADPITAGDASNAENAANPEAVAQVLSGKRDTANAAWWGFDPANSTAALQGAIDSGAARVIVPDMGKDWIVEPIELTRDDQQIIFEPGVVVAARKDSFKGANDNLISIWNRKNVTLHGYGATLRMEKDYWFEAKYHRMNMGWRMILSIAGSSNIKVMGLMLRDGGGDGIYLTKSDLDDGLPYCKDVVIKDVTCDNNSRQGLTVISVENLLIESCCFNNTRGAHPMAGIDIEPNRGPQMRLVNIHIRNCIFDGNDQLGAHHFFAHMNAQHLPISILWENCYIRGGYYGLHLNAVPADGPGGKVEFRNIIVENTRGPGIAVRGTLLDTERIIFRNILIKNACTKVTDGGVLKKKYREQPAPILLKIGSTDNEGKGRVGGIEFHNVHLVQEKQLDHIIDIHEADTGALEGYFDLIGDITLSYPWPTRANIRVPIKDPKNITLKINGKLITDVK